MPNGANEYEKYYKSDKGTIYFESGLNEREERKEGKKKNDASLVIYQLPNKEMFFLILK